MYNVKITALRQTTYPDLSAAYEHPQPVPCELTVGQTWVAVSGQRPEHFCDSAWQTLCPFVEALARGEGGFYGQWMLNSHSAMLSCNDGFRPMTFLIERID
ncbi:MAG: TIGR04076 family protein [Bacteroidales bacterium]|nr:TIGR04076 family protein [Bacteroidales bacterium]